ncbi:MAG TPA: hypothetical protein VNT57_07335, partial [Desulfobacteria bacterium]|nr:hypothetical protein [Desulfobacteria bacterium]
MTLNYRTGRRQEKTVSVMNLILIFMIIIMIAAGFLLYFRYQKLGESPVANLGFALNKKPRFLFNIYGSRDSLLKAPMALYVTGKGLIYVANTEGHTVEVFNPNGSF